MDTQGSVTHIAVIFKFGDVSGPRAKKWPKLNCRLKPALVYVKIIGTFVCGTEPGGRGWGAGAGGWGGTWKCPELGPTHRWLSVGMQGCTYVCMLRTYVHMYIFGIKWSSSRSRPMGPGPTSPSDFFLEMANSPVYSLILPLNYIKMSSYFKYQVKSSRHFVIKSIWNFEVSNGCHIFWHYVGPIFSWKWLIPQSPR